MEKRALVSVLCMIMVLTGCGQQIEIQDLEMTQQEHADEEEQQEEPENLVEGTEEQEPEQQEAEEEDQYAIYERFIVGDEPLYFREDLWGWNQNPDAGEIAMLEAGTSYTLDEICNQINRYDNSSMTVNEMEQLSYAYIDCGADGDVELALLFDNLTNLLGDGNSVIFIIKNIGGRLEMCYSLESLYRTYAELCNGYGMVVEGGYGGAGYESKTVGYIDADGSYVFLYDKDMEYWGYGTDIYVSEFSTPEFYQAMEGYNLEYVFVVTKYSFESRDYYHDYDQYLAHMKYSFELYERGGIKDTLVENVDPSVYMDSDYQEILDKAGIPFYSASEIDDMILEKAREIGLTEEMLNGKPIQWTALEEKDYDLIYGVEKEEGDSDSERAIEAYRRFLSDRGHFKETLAHSIGWSYENDIRYGMVDGFFIKDMNGDDVPELMIESADSRGAEQALFIYVFDADSGRVRLAHIFDAMGSMVSRESLTESSTPESDWLLYDMEGNALMLFGYNDANQLVWFHHGISADESITMYWCDYSDSDVNLTLHYYYEDCNMWERTPVYYEMKEISDSRDEAEKTLAGYKPFLFYDVTPENIEKYVNVNYLDAGMESYDKKDVIIDKEMFAELYDDVVDLYSQSMFLGKRFGPDENSISQFPYEYNLEYLIQLYDRLSGW